MIALFRTDRVLSMAEMLRPAEWQISWFAGATGGALIGHLLWVMAQPRQRISRAATACALVNALVWLSFVTVTPPLDGVEFGRVENERVQRDPDPGRLDLVTDRPIVVAGRWHGTFGAMNLADWLLSLLAGPAIEFAALVVVPSRFIGLDATKGESYAIAGLGLVLSTAFWLAFGDMVTALGRAFRKRAPMLRRLPKSRAHG